MDSKSDQTNPFYASAPSGKTYASVVAAANNDGVVLSIPKEFDSSSEIEKEDSATTDATSSLSPKPEAVTDEKAVEDGKGVTEENKEAIENEGEGKLVNGSVDVGEKQETERDGIGEESESKVKGVEDDEVTKKDDGNDGGEVDVDEKIEDGAKLTKEGDASSLEAVDVDVVKPGVAVVGEVEGSEEFKIDEDSEKLELANKFEQIGDDDEVGEKLESGADSVTDSSQLKSGDSNVVKPEVVAKSGTEPKEVEEANVSDKAIDEVGEKVASKVDSITDSSLVESADTNAVEPEVVAENGTKPKDVEEEPKGKTYVEVIKADSAVTDSGTKDQESVISDAVDANVEEATKVTDKGDSIVDSAMSESVHIDVAKPGVVVVGDVEASEVLETDGNIGDVHNKFHPIGQIEDEGAELQSDNATEEAGDELTSARDVDSSTLESVHVDVAKPGVVVVGDMEGSKVLETDGNIADVHNKFDPIGQIEGDGAETPSAAASQKSVETGEKLSSEGDSVVEDDGAETPTAAASRIPVETEEKLPSEGDSILDSSVVDSVDADITVAEPEKEDEIKQDDEVDKTIPNIAEAADLTATKEISDPVRVESDEPKVDVEKEELPVSESVNVGSVDAREDSKPADESQSELDNGEEGGNKIPVEDVSRRELLGLMAQMKKSKEVDQEPSGEGVIRVDGSESEEETEEMIFGSSEAAKQFLAELEKASSGIEEGNLSNNMSDRIDGQIVTDSEDEVDTEDEGEEKMFDSAALAALLKAATGGGSGSSEGGNFTITSQDGTKLFSMDRPAGLSSSSFRPFKPAAGPRPNPSNYYPNPNVPMADEVEMNLTEEEKQKLEKLQNIRVKFLRLLQRIGHSTEDSVAAQVLYRLQSLAGRRTGQMFSLDAAKQKAVASEVTGNNDLDFSLNILVLGKAGVGKSATINSILGHQKASIDAFGISTTSVREVSETVNGVKITFIDTPGLKSAAMDQSSNVKMLSSVKKAMNKCPPDIVLYVDRLDAQTRDLNNLPLLRTITASLGTSIWKNAIVTLTHAASAPPDGPSGTPLSYDVFVAQCSHIVQQSIGQATGDLRLMNPALMNPVSLVENHPLCRKNRDGVKVLPNGQTWRSQLLLYCYSLKVFSEANSLTKPQEPLDQRKHMFGFRVRSPPLPYLLSWLLQSRAHPKLAADQGGDSVDSDIEVDDVSDSEQEDGEEDEYDQLPTFKPLRKTQLAKLSKEQRKAYFEEYDYRVKLLQKKQWKEELKRMKEMKKNGGKKGESEFGFVGEEEDPENGAPAAVPVPLPDMVLPPSFDSDNSAYRYRFLEPTSQLLTRPVLDTNGWDHDCGYDGVNAEHSLALASKFPATATVQVTKDKKDFNIHLDSSVSTKHGENGSTMVGFDIQNAGKQRAYVIRGETKFKNLKKNKTTLGGSVIFLGENIVTGVKLEDQISLGKRFVLVGSTGTMRYQEDSAYGANLEVRLKEADFPIGQDQHSLGLSLVKWKGDLALGGTLQSQVSVGRNSKIALRAGLNNKMSGQITLRTSSSDQLQIALTAILPIAMSIYRSLRPEGGPYNKYSMY